MYRGRVKQTRTNGGSFSLLLATQNLWLNIWCIAGACNSFPHPVKVAVLWINVTGLDRGILVQMPFWQCQWQSAKQEQLRKGYGSFYPSRSSAWVRQQNWSNWSFTLGCIQEIACHLNLCVLWLCEC